MFLKGLKAKSNQKFIDKSLTKRKVIQSKSKIKTAGVLLNYAEFSDYKVINELLDDIKVESTQRNIITFIDNKEIKEIKFDSVFGSKDFGWRGKLKNSNLEDFTKTKFDVLICYFLGDDIELKQIAAMSNAKFKIGISNNDERLYDLIIDVKTNDFLVFKTELKKYLTILNKI